jgi:helicase
MKKSLAALQKKSMPINKIITEMISADMIRSIESEDGGAKSLNRLGTTPLGRIATRHLLQPLTVMMVKDLLQNLPNFTHFDALFALALTPDCEPVIPVDFEELSIFARQLDGIPSFVFFQIKEVRKWLLNPSGKRILSALKTAVMLLAWCENDDESAVAEEFSIYTFELTRLQESFNRLLTAAAAISNYVLQDPNNSLTDEAPQKPEATQRLELLRHIA